MSSSSTAHKPGRVTLIGGGPGAVDLITLRGARALERADVILTDHLGPAEELDRLVDVTAKEVIDVAKLPYGRRVAQERINELLVENARAGKEVARLKGGDPFVFGRGFEELAVCAKAGIPCEVIPGISSPIAVPGLAGIPITQRGVVHAATVVSGHVPPGHESSLVDWRALAKSGATIAVIMGIRNARAIADELAAGGLDPATPAAIIQEGSTARERVARCELGTLADTIEGQGFRSPAVYVVGAVAGLEPGEAGPEG